MNAVRRAGRGTRAVKRGRLSATKQRVLLQQLEPVRGIEKIVIKPTGQMVTTKKAAWHRSMFVYLCCDSILPLNQSQDSLTLTLDQM